MQKTFNRLISFVFDLLAPPRRTESVVRALSIDDLLGIASPDGTLPYRDPRITALVWELKYRGNGAAAALAGEYLSDLLLAEASELLGKPLLVPMPMHAARRRERGYNQTELLCEAALTALKTRSKNSLGAAEDFFDAGFEYSPLLLERVRDTAPQQGLARHKRLTNVKNSMQVKDPAAVKGRVCIVVDDVSTTGASFAEARRSLLKSGAQTVRCIALAES